MTIITHIFVAVRCPFDASACTNTSDGQSDTARQIAHVLWNQWAVAGWLYLFGAFHIVIGGTKREI